MERLAAVTASLALLLLGGLLSACGEQAVRPGTGASQAWASPPPAVNAVPAGYDGRFRVAGTVLESPDHGPQLCDAVMESYPPQCGGADVVGWSWDGLEHESASGTRWGTYLLVGTFEAGRFTLTEPARVDNGGAPGASPDFSSPCPAPAGGWAAADPGTATDVAMTAALEQASRSPHYAGSWIDQNGVVSEADANDPLRLVLNVRFTADLARYESELVEIWGGALCVSGARYSEAELLAIQAETISLPGVTGSGIDVVGNVLQVSATVADDGTRRMLAERYGPAVQLIGWLEPID